MTTPLPSLKAAASADETGRQNVVGNMRGSLVQQEQVYAQEGQRIDNKSLGNNQNQLVLSDGARQQDAAGIMGSGIMQQAQSDAAALR